MMKNLLFTPFAVALLLMASAGFSQTLFLVQEPSNLSGTYDFTDSFSADGWGADLDTTAVTAPAVFALDDGTYEEGGLMGGDSAVCGPVVNTAEVAGKIAFIYRGTCNFSLKAYQAQAAGAVGCVIVNNEPGNLVNMLAGDSATAVVIPTVFVSDATGAALADSINAGSVEIFLGNPNGVFGNNIGAYAPHIGMANSGAIPQAFAESSSDFSVPVGAWIFNFGSNEAVNAVLDVEIDRDGSSIVYNETSSGVNILAGDSVFVSLPTYSEDGYEAGLYTMTYSLLSDATDELAVDNELSTTFWINGEGVYSKCEYDPEEGPTGSGGLRPLDEDEYEWCIALESENAEALHALGMTFATVTNEEVSLAGNYVLLNLYEWNDDITTALSFDDLNELTSEIYDYSEDLQSEFVTYMFEEPIELVSDQKYLGCVRVENANMFIVTDGVKDYNVTAESYPDEVFFPLNGDGAGDWFGGGFGTENVPSIVLNLGWPDGIAEDVEKLEVTPYPNPTTDMINIPLGGAVNGEITIDVFSVAGALVHSETICQKTNNLKMDVNGLNSGLHTFNLTFEDKSTTSFQVMIAR